MSKLTNDELRLAIAKAQGLNARLAKSCWIDEGEPLYEDASGDVHELPNWPADIAAAWELVEEMRQSDNTEVYLEAMYNHFGIHRRPPTWKCP